MAEAFLSEIVAAASADSAPELRVYVIAWGMTFDGIVSNSRDYAKALLATIAENFQSVSGEASTDSERIARGLAKASGVASRDGDEKYLHLRSTRTENGGTLPWLRIPFDDVSGFALQAPQSALRSKAGF